MTGRIDKYDQPIKEGDWVLSFTNQPQQVRKENGVYMVGSLKLSEVNVPITIVTNKN